jgi:hypothetical protein
VLNARSPLDHRLPSRDGIAMVAIRTLADHSDGRD